LRRGGKEGGAEWWRGKGYGGSSERGRRRTRERGGGHRHRSEEGRRRWRCARKKNRRGQWRSVAAKEVACARERKGKKSPRNRGGFGFRASSREAGRKTPEVLISEPRQSSDLTPPSFLSSQPPTQAHFFAPGSSRAHDSHPTLSISPLITSYYDIMRTHLPCLVRPTKAGTLTSVILVRLDDAQKATNASGFVLS
jgi:hypothetical protein